MVAKICYLSTGSVSPEPNPVGLGSGMVLEFSISLGSSYNSTTTYITACCVLAIYNDVADFALKICFALFQVY